MTEDSQATPLNPEQQSELDALCESLDNLPMCAVTDVADHAARAKIVPQQCVLEELLVIFFRRKSATDKSVDEHSLARRLGLGDAAGLDFVRRAKRVAALETPTQLMPPGGADVDLPEQLMQDQKLRYELVRSLGQGGCGVVGLYRDKNRFGEPPVAVKLASGNDPDGELLVAEARAMLGKKHKALAMLYDYRPLEDAQRPGTRFPAIVMEYAPNGCLQRYMNRLG